MFYTYEHIRPDNGANFYVGKGKGSRCTEKVSATIIGNVLFVRQVGLKLGNSQKILMKS